MARTDEVGPAKPLEARSPVGVPGRLGQVFGTFRNDPLTEPQLAIYMLHSIVATLRCVLPAFDVEATLLNGVSLARELQRRPERCFSCARTAAPSSPQSGTTRST